MKVIAKYKRVEITFSNECVSVNCLSIQDALTYSDWYKRVLLIRERARVDTSYPNELYDYLKEKGIINADLFKSRQRMLRKAHLLSSLTPRWM